MSKESMMVEHIWAPPESIPMTVLAYFPLGAAVVWYDEEFVAAIPATAEQMDALADLMEAVQKRERNMSEYFALRDKFCGEMSIAVLSLHFKLAMEKLMAEEEAVPSKYALLASAARNN